MADTLTCDNCGASLTEDEMKEVFTEGSEDEKPERLCASCLDKRMNDAPEVVGVEGEDKRRAALIPESGSEPERETFGKRD